MPGASSQRDDELLLELLVELVELLLMELLVELVELELLSDTP